MKIWRYVTGKEALQKEREIKQQFKHAQWIGESLLKDGNTELFEYDILQLDQE